MNQISKFVASAICAAAIVACGGGSGGGSTSAPVAATNTTLTFGAANGPTAVQAILNQGFTFPSGIPAFGTTNPTTVTISAGTGGAYNYTVRDTVTGSTGTGTLQFGSCIFKGNGASPIVALRTDVVINPCAVNASTANKSATGTAVDVPATLTFGGITSNPVTLTVTINPTTGAVSVGTTVIGTVTVQQTTGATGGS